MVKKYSIGNNKNASAHFSFLQKSVWETFVISNDNNLYNVQMYDR